MISNSNCGPRPRKPTWARAHGPNGPAVGMGPWARGQRQGPRPWARAPSLLQRNPQDLFDHFFYKTRKMRSVHKIARSECRQNRIEISHFRPNREGNCFPKNTYFGRTYANKPEAPGTTLSYFPGNYPYEVPQPYVEAMWNHLAYSGLEPPPLERRYSIDFLTCGKSIDSGVSAGVQ